MKGRVTFEKSGKTYEADYWVTSDQVLHVRYLCPEGHFVTKRTHAQPDDAANASTARLMLREMVLGTDFLSSQR